MTARDGGQRAHGTPFLITVGLLWKFKKIPEPIIVLGAAILGLVIYPLAHP